MFTAINMPKCPGSMPSFVMMGKKIGAMISRIDEGSIRLPAANGSRFTTSREDPGAELLADHRRRQSLNDVLFGHQERELYGVGDDVEEHRAEVGCIEQHLGNALERQVFVDKDGDEEGVDRCHRRCLGRLKMPQSTMPTSSRPQGLSRNARKRSPQLARFIRG
jgi:hypothetical protein